MSNTDPHSGKHPRDKIKSLDELAAIADQERAAGGVVVLAHGVFDLLHLGHVRHLEQAKREGSLLIVTLTADRFVNKGPGRPAFPELLRAEMLAAVGLVDWVGVNYKPSAENVLETVKPDVYVKGSDYENPDDDITGKISSERAVVEQYGGRLVITRDITFSSSTLINRYLNVYNPTLRDALERMRADGGADRLNSLIDRVADYRVVLVGEAIIDEYCYVRPMGKSAKENILASRFEGREIFSGGVLAAANHLASFCREVEVITCLGEHDSFEDHIRANLLPNVQLSVIERKGLPTTRKCRFVDPGYTRKMFEVYHFDDSMLDAAQERHLEWTVRDRTRDADVVIVTDFGHGMISPGMVGVLTECSPFLAVNTQTNAGNQGFNLISKYGKADFICLDEPEARLAVADRFSNMSDIIRRDLPALINCPQIIITHGKRGCITFNRETGAVVEVPAFADQVVDTVGAGDAFFVVAAPLVRAGGDIEQVGFIGNAVGAIKVGIVGHRRSVEKTETKKFITALLK